MSIAADHAYHVQYNMVMVSSDWIRGIYADRFGVPLQLAIFAHGKEQNPILYRITTQEIYNLAKQYLRRDTKIIRTLPWIIRLPINFLKRTF